MSLEAFLHELHAGLERTKAGDYEIDWEDAPLPYKLYRGLPVVALSADVPLTLDEPVHQPRARPELREFGHFLWYVYGLTQLSQSPLAQGGTMQSARRFVPSGGGLYPSELYVYLKVAGAPSGIYHYDAAHHRLVLLRSGEFDTYVARALGHRCNLSKTFATVFVSTMYGKNFFKYQNFSYRLQGLDAGAVIGQLLEVGKRFDYEAGVCFQFLDRAVHHLLGVSEQEEAVYAIIPLYAEGGAAWLADGNSKVERITADDMCRELPAIEHEHFVRSSRVKEHSLLIRMNESAQYESTEQFRCLRGGEATDEEGAIRLLPQTKRLEYDLAAGSRQRYSPEQDFILGKVTTEQLAALLQEATAALRYRNDLDEQEDGAFSRLLLYSCLFNIEAVEDGAYCYDAKRHGLYAVRSGDHRLWLQYAMAIDNVNLMQVPICIHVAGNNDHLISTLGYRGYRIQQMEAGMLVQRVLLTAAALGLGGHPLLGYDVNVCDELYGLGPEGKTSLIQIPVGPYRHRPRLQGGMHA
ncbi:SagB family peptide dehydrogenase [Brevibacillus centrosporus]|uniref:SagB family peptide dehydrogenase n=1 Tax=Brevibacillus centrosporus TaxID=54910 RepID=UPI003B02449D